MEGLVGRGMDVQELPFLQDHGRRYRKKSLRNARMDFHIRSWSANTRRAIGPEVDCIRIMYVGASAKSSWGKGVTLSDLLLGDSTICQSDDYASTSRPIGQYGW